MKNINYEDLIEKLYDLVEYEDRPDDLCEELMINYGEYFDNGTVYHGAFGHTEEDVKQSYYGFVSCSFDKDVAESFARSDYYGKEICTVFKVDISMLYGLNIRKLIEECYRRYPNNEMCKSMYRVYRKENEVLLYYEDIKDGIEFLNNEDE